MAAVLVPAPTDLDPRPRHRRPELRLVPPLEPRRRVSEATYRRRRLVAGLLAAAVVLALGLGLSRLGVAPGPAIATVTAADAPGAVGAAPAAGATYVVQPGDTIWGIARSLQPEGDVRPLVDELSARAGGAGLTVGQRLDLVGLAG